MPPRVPAWQLALRFGLEVVALVGLSRGASALAGGSWLAAAVAPLVAAGGWVTFAVVGDPSRSGRAPVPVPGWARLLLELVVLGGGLAGLWVSGAVEAAAVFGVVFVVHHAGTVPRLTWLLRQ